METEQAGVIAVKRDRDCYNQSPNAKATAGNRSKESFQRSRAKRPFVSTLEDQS
jgi:hypothetical protein